MFPRLPTKAGVIEGTVHLDFSEEVLLCVCLVQSSVKLLCLLEHDRSHSSTIQHKTTVTLFPRYNNKLEMLLYVNTKTSFFPTVSKSSTGFQWFYLSNTVSLSNSWDFDEPNRHRGSLLELMLVTDKELNQSKGNR